MGSGASKPPPKQQTKPTSTPAVSKVQPQRGQAQTTPRRGQGFKEVKLQDPSHSSNKSAGQTSPSSKNKMSGPSTSKASAPPSQTVSPRGPNAKASDDIVFETFYHNSGRVYTCLYRSGIRYFLDNWKTEEWQIFPMKWYNEGRLVTESLITGGQTIPVRQSSSTTSATSQPDQARQSARVAEGLQEGDQSGIADDRESTIRHPTKGKLPTYIFEVRRNVNCYYDEEIGQWVKLPIGWELQSDMVRKHVEEIQEAIPEWQDRCDILAALRTCNYDMDDCIETYLAWGQVITALHPVQKSGSKDSVGFLEQLEKMENQVHQLKGEADKLRVDLAREKELRLKAEKQSTEFQKKYTDLEAEAKVAIVQLEVMQTQQSRPKTARPKTPAPPTPAPPTPAPQTPAPQAPAPQIVKEIVVEQNVDPESIVRTQKSVVQVHKSYTGLKLDVQNMQKEVAAYIIKISDSLKLIRIADKQSAGDLTDLRSAYRKECIQRKQLYNQLQELRGNIRVFCRCRQDSRAECCLKFVSSEDIVAPGPSGSKKQFRFDKIYDPKSTQSQVFEDTLPIIASCVDGYNVCILAYGQTGSGKTYTMMGPDNDPGVNIRSVRELLKICEERDNVTYELKCSLLEIYNETVQDLLTKESKALEVRAHGKNIDIPGLTIMDVKNVDDIKRIMKLGDENRSVASTKMNSSSSRSHLIMMINVIGVDKVSKAQSTGILTMCDLAGSERISKTEATGQRLVEAAAINKSLTSLGQVFSSLRTNQLHVPYRNSKLTHILQPCLGGDAKVAMFIAVSPDVNNVTETVSTLQYGANARQVQLGQAKQNVQKSGPPGPK